MITREMAALQAQALGCETAAVLAVAEVESANAGFLPDGRPAMLFEAQWFHHFTGGRFDASHPQVSSPVWDRALYLGGAREYFRLNEAIELDAEAAFKSASFGAFQIMGFNFKACGYASVAAFWSAMKQSIDNQLAAFANFVHADPELLTALRDKYWPTFTRIYNGPGNVAVYSGRVQTAYQVHARQDAAYAAGIPLPPELLPVPGFDGPPIPAADCFAPPAGYVETEGGNVVLANVADSGIVKNADLAKTITKYGTAVGSAGSGLALLGGVDWKIVAVLAAAGLVAWGLFLLNRVIDSKNRRVTMAVKGVA